METREQMEVRYQPISKYSRGVKPQHGTASMVKKTNGQLQYWLKQFPDESCIILRGNKLILVMPEGQRVGLYQRFSTVGSNVQPLYCVGR